MPWTNHEVMRPNVIRHYTAILPQVVSHIGWPCRRGPFARFGNQCRSIGLTNDERKKLNRDRNSDFMKKHSPTKAPTKQNSRANFNRHPFLASAETYETSTETQYSWTRVRLISSYNTRFPNAKESAKENAPPPLVMRLHRQHGLRMRRRQHRVLPRLFEMKCKHVALLNPIFFRVRLPTLCGHPLSFTWLFQFLTTRDSK